MLTKYLGVVDLPLSLQQDVKAYLSTSCFRTFIESLTYITFTLYLLDSLPAEQVGFLWAVNFAVHGVLDYPTGVLGDLIGHKRVLLLAYLQSIIFVVFLING